MKELNRLEIFLIGHIFKKISLFCLSVDMKDNLIICLRGKNIIDRICITLDDFSILPRDVDRLAFEEQMKLAGL